MKITTLSIIIPAFNEARTIGEVLRAVAALELEGGIRKEIVVVDDKSYDGTKEVVEAFMIAHPEAVFRYLVHPVNRGKGAAVRTGIGAATGEYVVIQDADLELDPADINVLLRPVLSGEADAVYGSRFLGGRNGNAPAVRVFVNRALTVLSNLVTGLRLTDMETCYKLLPADVMKGMKLKEDRFGFEPEVTAKLARIRGLRIREVPVRYRGRNRAQGKKIGWSDGVRTVFCIVRYGWGR